MSCKFFTLMCQIDRGRESENNSNNSFISFRIEGGGVSGGHTPPAPPRADLVYPRLITREVEQCDRVNVAPRRPEMVPGGTIVPGLEVLSKEDVHDHRTPVGMGVGISA